ncbi:sensor histidine kinase [Microbacterium pygmaeum]|uniref:histidine kinase n=1 Tax=Microbacterium pygmaeum TaxID=370764 RepID=A0A1G7YBQ8_9MICO|nr:HAMP domain-containing sensor histidine kinase [Microbacterium pygmaeum]SDG93729.1 two-component system, OmpR family, sensor kinase [Microbacterium pygmaeum]
MTGVTVTLLAFGLIAAGFGTAVFLRNTLLSSLDDSLRQVAPTEIGAGLFDLQVVDDVVAATDKDDVPCTDYHVALYQQGTPGDLLISGCGGEPDPDFPAQFTAEQAYAEGLDPFDLEDAETGAKFRASVAPLEILDGRIVTQLVALPTAPVNQVVASFLGIYSILALITLVIGTFATRYLVTFAFRSLGQVESTAMAIAGGDFSLRMTDIEPTTTEVGRLKTAINAMLGRVDTAIGQRDASVRQMRRFIGDASHELRTPLVTVRGYAELYRMGAITGDDDVAQAMDRIEKEAMRMGVLVEDLLALARLDERRDVVINAVDLRPIARDAALDVRATAPLRAVTVIDTTAQSPEPPTGDTREPDAAPPPAKGGRRRGSPSTATLRTASGARSLLRRRPRPAPPSDAVHIEDVPPTPPELLALTAPALNTPAPVVLGDENRIRQVVANLLGNARRFTAEDSPIELRVGVDVAAAMGWIEVADHGEGVPEQIRDKIFQRFWRADTSRARETGGTGLGLSIVASIVDALHGAVSVDETPGGGATFRVAFPLAHERDAAEHLLIETQPLQRIDLERLDEL